MIEIVLNGEKKNIEKQMNLRELLVEFDISNERVAVELNQNVVRRKDWISTGVCDKDQIEVIHFVGGG